jgi:cellulose synthase/poly-beta-1,6-N-acetylglucosamine synthase-like glycosyltransferase|uniref:Glycosyltransferase n=1 Tax=candidate division WOR-3 bacterium TaxID=2052148 RepID=A0A7V3PUK7_UNCW3
MFDWIAIIFFWGPLILFIYHWFIFPLILILLVKFLRKKENQPEFTDFPKITIAIAAWNEELTIAAKLHNCQELDYPPEKIEILVGTDAVTDRTNDIVRSFADKDSRVRLIAVNERLGKSAVINMLAENATGDIILFTDADVLLAPQALRISVGHFRDNKVGLVLPAYRRQNEKGIVAEGLWDKFENKIKELEGKIGAAVGVYGWAMFLRRSLYKPLPPDIINDDYVLGIFVFRQGYKSVYEPKAISWTRVEPPVVEFKRKMRISKGNAQQFFRYSDILSPKYGLVAWIFFSHKYLRWFIPFFLISILLTCAVKVSIPFFRVLLILQLIVYLTTPLVPYVKGKLRKMLIPQYYVWVNLALLAGYWQYFFGKRPKYNWLRTERRID